MKSELVSRASGFSEIVYDGLSFEKRADLRAFVEESSDRLAEWIRAECVIVLGGDGTMLRAIRERHGDGRPFFGVNFGTKGFLLNRVEDCFAPGAITGVEYPLLDIRVSSEAGERSDVAFNEAQIKTAGGHMVTLDVEIGGHSRHTWSGDGMLVVTPAGSTGYNRSAKGPILPHESPMFLATPLLAFAPKDAASVPFMDRDSVTVRHRSERGQTLSVYADSTPVVERLAGPVEIAVSKRRETVRLLIPEAGLAAWRRRPFEEQ